MKRAMCGLLAVVALLSSHGGRADIFAPAGDCGFGMPCQGGTRQMQAVCEGDEVQLTYTEVYQVCEVVSKKVSSVVDGKTIEQDVYLQVCKSVPQMKTRTAPINQVKAFGLDRKKINLRQLKKRLAESTTVLVCEGEQTVPGAYLKLVKPDTIVLILPTPSMQAMPAPMPSAPLPLPVGAVPAPAPAPPAPAPAPPVALPAAVEPRPMPPVAIPAIAQPVELAVPNRGQSPASFVEPLAVRAKVADNLVQLHRTSTTTRQMTTRSTEEVDGKEVQRDSQVNYSTRTEQSVAYAPQVVRASTVAGEELTTDELVERLASDTPVLVSSDGLPINPRFLEIFRDDVLLIQVPIPQPALPIMQFPPAAAPGNAPGPPPAAPPPAGT